jgi:hypothetical protein
MDHWEYTEEIKKAAKTQRRLQGKKVSREAAIEHFSEPFNKIKNHPKPGKGTPEA